MTRGGIRTTAMAASVLLAALPLGACESSQDKSARLEKQGAGLQEEKGVAVGRENTTVKVVKKTSVTDENGTAVIVRLKSSDSSDQVDLPVIFDLSDGSGESLATNSTPGLQRTLTHAMVVPGKSESWWVNDQVFATEKPSTIKVQVGKAASTAPREIPDFKPSKPVLKTDPVDGLMASGKISNPTKVDQRKVLVTIVATKGGRPVAAGRGVVSKVRAGKRARYTVFFIGNPKGARLEIASAPTLFGAQG